MFFSYPGSYFRLDWSLFFFNFDFYNKAMVFSSLFFLFFFLTIVMIVYVLVKENYKNTVLLISSLIFYGWGGPQYLFLLIGETFAAWLFALLIQNRPGKKRLWLFLLVFLLVGLLVIFKYLPLMTEIWNSIVSVPIVLPDILLPIGISFYTFQLISYVADVYKKEVKAQPDYFKLLLYSSLFFQCIAGPIVRYKTIAREIEHRHVNINDIYAGIRRFSIGLAKKAILANGVAKLADSLAGSDPQIIQSTPAVGLWLGVFCFMLQLYLDFSAYSDMAIGLGRMVGFHFQENFDYPYQAKSVHEFWRRWHISLSTFFRDYVYIPLGGNRGTVLQYVRNMSVVWLLTGLWHGAHLNYVLWGLYYLVFLLLERFVIKEKIPTFWNSLYTLSVVFFGTMIFRYEDLGAFWMTLLGMFNFYGAGFGSAAITTLFLGNLFLLAAAVIACFDFSFLLHKAMYQLAKRSSAMFYLYSACEILLPITLFGLSFLALIGNTYNPFLYFQF